MHRLFSGLLERRIVCAFVLSLFLMNIVGFQAVWFTSDAIAHTKVITETTTKETKTLVPVYGYVLDYNKDAEEYVWVWKEIGKELVTTTETITTTKEEAHSHWYQSPTKLITAVAAVVVAVTGVITAVNSD